MKEVLTTSEAAKILGFHTNTMKNWLRKGKMPSFKTFGGHYRIRIGDLLNVLREHNMPIPEDLLDQPRYSITVVSNDAGFREQLTNSFSGHELIFEMTEFDNCFDALVDIGRCKPNLIVIDTRMEDADCGQLLPRLKKNPETANIRVIAVSGNGEEKGKIIGYGADDFHLFADGAGALIAKMETLAAKKFFHSPDSM
jgi:excisionase family DNA binding protein